ncbi:uncharacterized protein LOC9636139 [Selaginella moellendorffii]|uniref:uncharacterized protein LOC9636139 n=1 Tax=Selaginella moellendorffii TaxID=88036 RepID=UPI000D1CE277|nr:uncharacterized protein LOC9636139 [Selaginella moellendorffii]|eukprot:XP_002979688.2 uncharacterized protein LOC9636139 [Selaginella moellendorffii]
MDLKWDQGFWGSFAKRAKEALYESGGAAPSRPQDEQSSTPQAQAPGLQKGFDVIATSLSRIGDTLGNAIEGSLNVLAPEPKHNVKSKTALLKEEAEIVLTKPNVDDQTQLKASRDVAMAMASKVKLLVRELKTVKKNLADMRDRCSQLEQENQRLRDSVEKGPRSEDDDLVRKQLETLVAEKSRLSQQNANYARENQFLHEVIEYHRLTMEDVSLLDERIEEMAETMQENG